MLLAGTNSNMPCYAYQISATVWKGTAGIPDRRRQVTKFYQGWTNTPQHRIKQHNGVMPGGAKGTTGIATWTYCFLVTADNLDKALALSLESALKARNDVKDKLPILLDVLLSDRFKHLRNVYIYTDPNWVGKLNEQLQARFGGDSKQRIAAFTQYSGVCFDGTLMGFLSYDKPVQQQAPPMVRDAILQAMRNIMQVLPTMGYDHMKQLVTELLNDAGFKHAVIAPDGTGVNRIAPVHEEDDVTVDVSSAGVLVEYDDSDSE